MKRTKKWLLSALAIACTATSALAVTSCKDDHEHVYTDVVTAPTCTAEGFTTHTCECGDSYVDTKVDATGHNYTTQIKYPTLTEAGEKATVCLTCGDKNAEVLPAWSTQSSKIIDVVFNAISSGDVKFAVDANSTLSIDGIENLDQYIYEALAQSMGVEVDQAKKLVYIAGELASNGPKLANLLMSERPVITESYINEVKALLALVGQDLIVETKDGANSVYTVDLSALNHFVDDVKDETVASYMNRLYGAGSMEALVNFATTLPEKTVRELANSAIALASTYDIDVYYIYYLVNMVASEAGAEDFDIQALIEAEYDKTVGGLIIEASGDDTMTVEAMKAVISQYATMISGLSIDSVYSMATGSEESLTEYLGALIEALPEMASASLTFDANGALVNANLFVDSYTINLSVVGNEYVLTCELNGLDATLSLGENGISFTANQGEDELANIEFLKTANGYEADITVDGNDFLDLSVETSEGCISAADITIRALEGGYYESEWNEYTESWESVYIPEELVTQAEINYDATVVNGVITSAHAEIFGWDGEYHEIYDEYDNWIGSEWVEEWKEVADFTYTNNDGNISLIGLFEDEGKIELTNEKTDSSNVFTMEVWDLQAGYYGDEVEQLGEFTFGYETVGEQTTLFANMVSMDDGETKEMLDAELVVENGVIVSCDYVIDTANLSGHGYSHEYEVGDVLYRDCEDTYPSEVVELHYVTTENGGEWSTLTTYTEKVVNYTERWDADLEEWVLVGAKMETMPVYTTQGANIEYALTETGVTITVESVLDGVVENAVEVTLSETGVILSSSSYGTDVTLALNAIENGIQYSIVAPGVDITLDVTFANNVLHIGYDLGETEMVSGKGGFSITLS